jgi:hypothetical protein
MCDSCDVLASVVPIQHCACEPKVFFQMEGAPSCTTLPVWNTQRGGIVIVCPVLLFTASVPSACHGAGHVDAAICRHRVRLLIRRPWRPNVTLARASLS